MQNPADDPWRRPQASRPSVSMAPVMGMKNTATTAAR